MNVNEVIAIARHRAPRRGPSTPTTTVNASQSSNDVFPSAIHLAAASEIAFDLVPALEHLAKALRRKAAGSTGRGEGRPHPPDGRRARHPRPGARRLRHPGRARRRAPLGGAAPGRRAAARRDGRGHRAQRPEGVRHGGDRRAWPRTSSLPAHRGARPLRGPGRARRAGRGQRPSAAWSPSASTRSPTTCAGWLSGPPRGLAEIHLPDLQPGSSIMPGKVNPVVPRSGAAGRRPGDRQRRRRRLRRSAGATSS